MADFTPRRAIDMRQPSSFHSRHVKVPECARRAFVVYVLEFLATNPDGTRRTIEVLKQRAKNNSLIEEKAKTFMKEAFPRGRADFCVIKDQMGQVHSQVIGV
jgi:hypothetical protein